MRPDVPTNQASTVHHPSAPPLRCSNVVEVSAWFCIIGTAILHLLRGENSRSTVFAPHVSSLQGLSGEKWRKIS
jgi:hypothetical protein